MEERSFLEGQRNAARVEEDLQEMDAEEASNDATALSFVHAIKTMVRKATTENQLEFMTVDQRNELIRILRKSSDFRSDHELDHLMTMFHHIHFPSAVRIPGINPDEEVRELFKVMAYRRIAPGSYVYSVGDWAEEVYIVLQGNVDVDTVNSLKTAAGVGQDLAAGPGAMFGEDAGTTAEAKKRAGMAVTSSECHLAALSRTDINRVYRNTVRLHAEKMKARFEIEATGHLRGFFSGWEFLKETDGIRIYQKTNKANKLRSFKGIGFIDKPHNEVANYVFDMENRFDWDPLYMGGRVIEKVDSWKCVRQDAFYTPSPLHYNRDFLSLYIIERDDDLAEHYGISGSIQNVHIKERSDMVRAELFDTGFRVCADPKDPKGASCITFITQVNPKGNYPSWLTDRVNMQQAQYISLIRKAMTRILVTDKLKICLLETGMIFAIRTAFNCQHLDLWCFDHDNLNEVMDLNKTRRKIKKVFPEPGDYMYTNAGNKILEIIEDSFEGQIDFVNQSFKYRPYCESGAEDAHQECSDDLHERLMEYGLSPPSIPLPWPLFSTVSASGIDYQCLPSDAMADQLIKFKALRNVVMVVGSCSCSDHPEELLNESNIHISSSMTHYPGLALNKDIGKERAAVGSSVF